jgi:hypothetical protein
MIKQVHNQDVFLGKNMFKLALSLAFTLFVLAQALPAVTMFRPNHKTATEMQDELKAVYDKYKADCVVNDPVANTDRVARPNDKGLQINSTVSEGQGYGLIMAVYMNDRAHFDRLWRYTASKLNGNGLMDWYILTNGALGQNSGGSYGGAAPDADEDIIWGLMMAHYKWGSVTTFNYQALANAMIAAMLEHEVDGTPKTTIKVGDGWGGVLGPHNSSYFDPVSYKVFAAFTGDNTWLTIANHSYDIIELSINAANGNLTNGLVPAWHDNTGAPVSPFTPMAPEKYLDWYAHYQYDSCRTPFRIAKDYFLTGEPRAKAYLDKVNSFFPSKGAASIVDGYHTNGLAQPEMPGLTVAVNPGTVAAPFTGPAGVAAMADAAHQQFINDVWDQMHSVASGECMVGGTYYAECWAVLCMLVMSGQYVNLVPMPTPTVTLTPTATQHPCQVSYRINCGGGAVGAFVADQQYSAANGMGYLAAASGDPGTYAGAISNASVAVYNEERWTWDGGGAGSVQYQFDVPDGTYTVTLHLAETTASTTRNISAQINGIQKLNGVLSTLCGGNYKAWAPSYTGISPVNGHITIAMNSSNDSATIHAIEVVGIKNCTASMTPTTTYNWTATASPTISATRTVSPTFSGSPSASPTNSPLPTPDACTTLRRINCGGAAAGLFSADQLYTAGNGMGYLAAANVGAYIGAIAGASVAVYNDERYVYDNGGAGSIQYQFDVPADTYAVTLHLAETTAQTNRNLSAQINGVEVFNGVLSTLAGGNYKAWVSTYTGISPVNGHIIITMNSSNNSATIHAIEVIGAATCSPTRTSTIFGTLTHTPTITPTRTATASPTPTPSRTHTATPSVTPTGTLTVSPSGTATASRTMTQTLSATSTGTPASSPTQTSSSSQSATASLTGTLSATRTATGTPSATASPSRTATVTFTATLSFTPGTTASASPADPHHDPHGHRNRHFYKHGHKHSQRYTNPFSHTLGLAHCPIYRDAQYHKFWHGIHDWDKHAFFDPHDYSLFYRHCKQHANFVAHGVAHAHRLGGQRNLH